MKNPNTLRILQQHSLRSHKTLFEQITNNVNFSDEASIQITHRQQCVYFSFCRDYLSPSTKEKLVRGGCL